MTIDRQQFLIESARIDTAEAFLRVAVKAALEHGLHHEMVQSAVESECEEYRASAKHGAS
jgi:hypothetical protein